MPGGLDRHLRVELLRGGDTQQVELFGMQHVFEVGVEPFNAEISSRLFECYWILVAQCYELGVVAGVVCRGM